MGIPMIYLPMSVKRLARIQEDVNGIEQDLTPRLSTLWTEGLAGASKGKGILQSISGGSSSAAKIHLLRGFALEVGLQYRCPGF